MTHYLERRISTELETLAPVFDELTVWSSRFGLLLFDHLEIRPAVRGLDLGCGTGAVARHIKDSFLAAEITCVDIAENMLEMAKLKLSTGPSIRYQLADFRSYEFDEKYDAVVSSLALHHLEDEEKKPFYGKIFKSLNSGGIF